jgi:hypothetical protein
MMKLTFSKQAYDKLSIESRSRLIEVACECSADPSCPMCDGAGVLYEAPLSAEDQAGIQENFRRQGVPLGKAGTQ